MSYMTEIQQEVSDFYLGEQFRASHDKERGYTSEDYIRAVVETKGNFLSADPENVAIMEADG